MGRADSLVLNKVSLIRFECGEGAHGDGTVVLLRSPVSGSVSINLPDHRIHRRAGTMPWITLAALEQHNVTKDVNWAQRPLAAGGKLVERVVSWSGKKQGSSLPSRRLQDDAVKNEFGPHQLSTTYHHF